MVTILILIDGFLQFSIESIHSLQSSVTILILIDGFLQWNPQYRTQTNKTGHNPYFNRWFSAMCYDKNVNKQAKWSQSLF